VASPAGGFTEHHLTGHSHRKEGMTATGERIRLTWLGFAGSTFLLLGCEVQRQPPVDSPNVTLPDSLAVVQLIDSRIPPAIAGQDGWNYVESATADVMGDSLPERIVLTARVELYRGRPAWDDGQPWQVYVESQDGQRTYLYAQRLQLGTLTMRITRADSGRKARVLLIEHLPHRLRVLESRSTGVGLSLALLIERELDPRGEQASPRLR
jgi:hypothetical protein